MSNTKIVLNRQSDLILDKARLTRPAGIVKADIEDGKLVSDLSILVAQDEQLGLDIQNLETQHNEEMSVETSARIAGDEAEASRAVAAERGIQSELDALEVEHAADASTLQANIDAESSRAQAAEQTLTANLSTEVINRMEDVDAEEARAIAAEGSLETSINDMDVAYKSSDNALQANIDAEKSTV